MPIRLIANVVARCTLLYCVLLGAALPAFALNAPDPAAGAKLPPGPAQLEGRCAADQQPVVLPGEQLACDGPRGAGPAERIRVTYSCPSGYLARIDRLSNAQVCFRQTVEQAAARCLPASVPQTRPGPDGCRDPAGNFTGAPRCDLVQAAAPYSLAIDRDGARDTCIRVVTNFAAATMHRGPGVPVSPPQGALALPDPR